MTLDDENSGDGLKLIVHVQSEKVGSSFFYLKDGLKLILGTHGMNVPSACTIVIIAGIVKTQNEVCLLLPLSFWPFTLALARA